MLTPKEREEQKKRQNEESHREQLWSKPANDIITGIESNDSVPPERAIWELVQNAHDVSYESGTNIEFERHTDSFVFKHDGRPFEINNLNALNIQTSSKVRNSCIQIGQYGTGFLTTHKFGLKFSLDSSLMYVITDENGEEIGRDYHNFSNLLFDRSSHDKKEMRDRLEEQHQEISKIQEKFPVSAGPSPKTCFTYYQINEIERKNSMQAFINAESLAKYVMALNKRINSISFRDFADGGSIKTVCYSRISDSQNSCQVVEDGNGWKLEKVNLKVQKNEETHQIQCYLLHSKNETENGEPIVSIVLPILMDNNSLRTFEFEKTVPRLFLKLPLIGTENWGVNYIFNSPRFSCENDSRNSVRFAGNGQNNDEFAEKNREIIAEGQHILFDFFKNTSLRIEDKRHLVHINFDINNRNEKLSEYYSQIKKEWIDFFICKKLFPCSKSNLGTVNCGKFINTELQLACQENPQLLDAVYEFSASMLYSHEHLPLKEDFLFWSNLVSEWMPKEPSSFFISPSDIVEHLDGITNHNLAKFDWAHVLEFDTYLASTSANVFNTKCLIPNEKGIGFAQSTLKKPDVDNPILRQFLDTFLPEQTNVFVHPRFNNLMGYTIYGLQEIKDSLSNLNVELINKFSKASVAIKKKNQSEDEKKCISDALLDNDEVRALLRFLGLLVATSSDSFQSKIILLARQFYDFSEQETEVLTDRNIKDILDWRGLLRVLIHDSLLKISTKPAENKTSYSDWIFNMVQTLYSYRDYQDILRYYPLYLNEKGQFCYYDEVKKPDELPEELKDYFDKVILKREGSIREELIDSNYAPYLIEPQILKGIDLSDQINQIFLMSPYPDLTKSEYKNEIIEIITTSYSEKDRLLWNRLFNKLFTDKAILLLSIIESPSKKESLTRLMTIDDDEKLRKIAELSENQDMDLIIQLGKEALANKEREERDIKYKKCSEPMSKI